MSIQPDMDLVQRLTRATCAELHLAALDSGYLTRRLRDPGQYRIQTVWPIITAAVATGMVAERQPCGTPAAYIRHLRANEKPCDACHRANSNKSRTRRGLPVETDWQTDNALRTNPPRIEWRRVNGVMRAVEIDDPHGEAS
jgi:hypothetical protein